MTPAMTRPPRWRVPALRLAGLAVVVAVALAGACATTRLTPGQQLVRSKCGACHARPAPGDRPRGAMARILNDHRRRITLSEEQVRGLLEHLAPGPRPPAGSAR